MNVVRFCFIVAASVLTTQPIGAILLRQVSVPSVIQAGEGAILSCDVDMENERLYSAKWYKDFFENPVEFFRYVPRESPPVIIYNLDGINVNKSLSNWKSIYLNRVNLASSGTYRCEVSAEGPSFSSVSGGGHMEVVWLPRAQPAISGGKSNYRPGDLVNVNCTSAASKPAASINWFINEKKANESNVRQYKSVSGEDGLETTVLGLTFEVNENHLNEQGKLVLRCVTSVGPSVSTHKKKSLQAESTSASNHWSNSPLEHNENPVMETMEVKFEASDGSSFMRSAPNWTIFSICIYRISTSLLEFFSF